jgi:hypothetical protein
MLGLFEIHWELLQILVYSFEDTLVLAYLSDVSFDVYKRHREIVVVTVIRLMFWISQQSVVDEIAFNEALAFLGSSLLICS